MSFALVSAGLSAASSLAQYSAQRKAANEAERRFWENRQSSILSRDLKIRQLSAQADQQAEETAEKGRIAMIRALENQSRAKLAAGEAGVSGQSVQADLDNRVARSLRSQQSIAEAITAIQTNVQYKRRGLDSEMINRINSAPRGQQPSLGMALLGAGAGAASSYAGAGGDLSIFNIT